MRKKLKTKKSKLTRGTFFRSKTTLVLFLVALAMLVASLTLVIISLTAPKPFEVRVIPYDFTVKDSLSVNVDTDGLHFGGALPGAGLQRHFFLTSPQDAFVVISFIGPGNLKLSDNNFLLVANSTKRINISLSLPQDMAYGTYSGNVFVALYKPR